MTDLIGPLRDDILNGSIDPETALRLMYYKSAAHHYRCNREWQKSYDICTEALKTVPKDCKYLYTIYEELSIICYYLGKIDEGYTASDHIVTSATVPYRIRNYTLSNQQFYMSKLPFSRVIDTDFRTDCADFVPSSASILSRGTGYRLNIRSVNYRVIDGNYIPQGSNLIITRNHVVDLDKDFKSVDCKELIDKSGYPMTYRPWSRGLEDVRLICDGSFLCTTPDTNSKNIPQLVYAEYNTEDGAITKIVPLQLGPNLKCEKNWLPFIGEDDGQLYAVYSMDPLTIVKITPDSDLRLEDRVQIVQTEDSIRLPAFRGSGGLLKYKGGYLCSVHQVYYNKNRLYFHRLVWFNKDFTQYKYSKNYYLESPNIEYTLSMCHSDEGLIIPYSVRDSCSRLGILPYTTVDAILGI